MRKVRVTKAPKTTGSQDGYGLVRKTSVPHMGDSKRSVKTTMGELKGEDKEKAKIEVEDGETVLGDVNRDGLVELFEFVGKRHSQGGMDVDIPEGSFIFSDTPKLRIKDEKLLKDFFGIRKPKGGITPAKVSKKFQINEYIDILKNEESDELAKRTANEMLKNNMQKLGLLAFVQESMKGFPDGIPDIAQIALSELGVNPEELLQASAPQQEMPQQGQEQMMMEQGQPMPMAQYGGPAFFDMQVGFEEPQMFQNGGGYSSNLAKAKKKYPNAPGFGSWEEFETFKNQGRDYKQAAERYVNALASDNPADMMSLAKAIEGIDIDNSWGWVPWSDQDKLDDISEIVRESARKQIWNDAQSDVKKFKSSFSTLKDKLVSELEKKAQTQSGDALNQTLNKLKDIDNIEKYVVNDNAYVSGYGSAYGKAYKNFIEYYDDTLGTSLKDQYKFLYNVAPELRRPKSGVGEAAYVSGRETSPNYYMINDDLDQYTNLYTKGTSPSSSSQAANIFEYNGSQYKYAPDLQTNKNAYFDLSGNIITDPQMIKALDQASGQNISGLGTSVTNTSSSGTARQQQTVRQGRAASTPRSSAPANVTGNVWNYKTGGKVFDPSQYYMKGGKVVRKPMYQDAGGVGLKDELVDDNFPYTDPTTGQTIMVDRYKRTMPDGREVLVLRKSDDNSVFAMRDLSSKTTTVFGGDGYSYQYDSNNDLVSRGAPYVGDDWYKEGWEGKYMGTAKKFEDFMRNQVTPEMIDAMWKEQQKIVNDPAIEKAILLKEQGASTSQIEKVLENAQGYWSAKNLISRSQLEAMKNMSKEDFVDNLVKGNQTTSFISSVYADNPDFLQNPYWDKKYTQGNKVLTDRNTFYKSILNQVGQTPLSDDELTNYELNYQALQSALMNPEFLQQVRNAGLDITPSGLKDQKRGDKPISPIEGSVWMGNTLAGEHAKAAPEVVEEIKEEPSAPGKTKSYFCVQSEDGVISHIGVDHNVGEEPVAPDNAVSGPYGDLATAEKTCVQEQAPLQPDRPQPDAWFGNDIRNLLTAYDQDIYKGRPQLFQMTPASIGYDTLNPITRIAAVQSQSQAYNDMLENTMSGNAALAAALSSEGTFLDNLGRQIAEVEAQNVGIVNPVYAQNAQLQQGVNQQNVALRKKFADESTIFGQQLTNSLNKRAALRNYLTNVGWQNYFDDENLRYAYPQARYPNRITMGAGPWSWSGQGKSLEDDGVTNASNVHQGARDIYKQAYDEAIQSGMNEDAAIKSAENAQKYYYDSYKMNQRRPTGYSQARTQNRSRTVNPFSVGATGPYGF